MSAIISHDELYRYALMRGINNGYSTQGYIMFIMLNPSTADATLDDPTIRRLYGITTDEGYSRFVVCNLFAYRATNPLMLQQVPNPIGARNDGIIRYFAQRADKIICAWGSLSYNYKRIRARRVCDIIKNQKLHCLGLTQNGMYPRHPLYLKNGTKVIPYKPA